MSGEEDRPPRKDRLIQTRVPRQLETTLKEEARRRRLSVSHLIRNMLEESFQLVDGVVADVDQIVSDSVKLARNVTRGAARVAAASRSAAPGEAPTGAPPEAPAAASQSLESRAAADDAPAEADLEHVYAWNEVVLHRAAACSRCGSEIPRGETGYAGLSDAPGRPRAWLCRACIESL